MVKSLRPLEYCLGSETFTSETWHINEDTVYNFTHLKCILLWKFNFQNLFTVSPPMKKVRDFVNSRVKYTNLKNENSLNYIKFC